MEVKFPPESIPTVDIDVYISIYTSKSLLFCLFLISRLLSIFYPYSEFGFGFYEKFYIDFMYPIFFLKNVAFDKN